MKMKLGSFDVGTPGEDCCFNFSDVLTEFVKQVRPFFIDDNVWRTFRLGGDEISIIDVGCMWLNDECALEGGNTIVAASIL